MQLALVFLVLLLLQKNGGYAQLKPVLEELGGEGAVRTMKRAEELSCVIGAVCEASGQTPPANNRAGDVQVALSPIAAIADERILSTLASVL